MELQDIDVLLVMQVGLTALFIGAYSALTAYRQDEAYRVSDLQAATLVRILVDDHPDINGAADVIDSKPGFEIAGHVLYSEMSHALITGGPVEDQERYERRALEVYGYVLVPQVFLVLVAVLARQMRRARWERVETTSVRRNDMAKVSLGLVGSVGYLAAGGALVTEIGWLGYLLLALSAAGFLGSALAGLMVVKLHMNWKTYWRDRLAEVVLEAVRSDRQPAATRAMLAKQDIDATPFAPLPAALGFYIATFSVTQAALLGLARYVDWL